MDEAILVQAAQEGDLDAFNRLVLAHQDAAYNVACRILLDEDAADDATQTAFISAYRSLKTYRGGSFRAWVLRMVTNACLDELRRRKRRPTTPLEPETGDGEEMESPAWLAGSDPSPEESLSQQELKQALAHCLQALQADFRAVVVLVDLQGLDYREAACVIGKPVGTIKSRLARARLRMRDCLQDQGELLPAEFRQMGRES